MVVSTAYQYALDNTPTEWGPFEYEQTLQATSTVFQNRTVGGFTVTFQGNDLTYGSNGEVTGGTFTSVDVTSPENEPYLTVTEMQADAPQVFLSIANNDPQAFFRYIFRANDVFQGSPLADRLRIFNGNDRIFGFAGNDEFWGGAGVDRLNGGVGNDTLNGDAGNDVLNGDAGNDNLLGGTGNDNMVGGGGNDQLTGGVGVDVLRGGAGRDRFNFDIGRPFNRNLIGIDRIVDFQRGVDKIRIDRTTFTAFPNNQIRFASVANITQAQRSTALITYVPSTGALFYNQNRGLPGFGSGGQFAVLQNRPPLTASDFVVQT